MSGPPSKPSEVTDDYLLRDIAENLPGAIVRYIHYPDGSDFIEYMSTGCETIWELSAAEIHNDTSQIWDMTHPEDLAGLAESISASGKNLTTWHHTYRILPASGRVKWLEGRGEPHRRQDGSVLWNSVILDVTAEKLKEQEVARREFDLGVLRERLTRLTNEQAVGEITASIAHEVNQPLTSIMNYTHAARNMLEAAGGTDHIAEVLDKVLKQAKRCADIVDRSRSMYSIYEPSVAEFDTREFIEESISITKVNRRTSPETTLAVAPYADSLRADRILLQQVVVNLLRNAFDATGHADQPKVNVDVTPAETGVTVTISDNGHGIPDELQDSIFEPYVSTKSSGMGVGLSVSAAIMRAHGGNITVSNNQDGGATMVLFLPDLKG